LSRGARALGSCLRVALLASAAWLAGCSAGMVKIIPQRGGKLQVGNVPAP
jgi:hypothetical protein